MLLETERLVVRPWRVEEAPRLFEILSDPDTVRWFGTPQVITEVTEATDRIRMYSGFEPPRGVWAVADRGTDLALGSVMLIELEDTPLTQIGWYLHPDSTGHGYATEACAAVLAHGLASGYGEIRAVIDVDNAPSIAVAERLGMRRLGLVDEDTRPSEMYVAP